MNDPLGCPIHFGSTYGMTDYETTSHNAFFSANYMATEALNLFATLAFNMSDAKLDEIVMRDPGEFLGCNGLPVLENADLTYEETDEYSDLDFELLDLTLGIEYRLQPGVTLTLDGRYADLGDNAPYVYGDMSGSFTMVRTGIRFDF